MIKDIEAANRYCIETARKKKRCKLTKYDIKWIIRNLPRNIKNVPKAIVKYLDYRIKRLRYSDSDIKVARIFDIPISQAWALGQDGGNLYRKMKKGR